MPPPSPLRPRLLALSVLVALLLVALCNLALTPFVYPVVWALTERVPVRPARRW